MGLTGGLAFPPRRSSQVIYLELRDRYVQLYYFATRPRYLRTSFYELEPLRLERPKTR